jgi:pimeloyl-ACP methyl ester carboxylesterase
VTASGGSLEVRSYGSVGPAVVVLHGGPGAQGSAAGLARALASRFRVLEPLQRRSGDVPLTVAQHVADLSAIVPASALIVGHSWGAMLGLSFAAVHPDRVAALALVGCGTYDLQSRALYEARVEALLGPAGRSSASRLWALIGPERDPSRRDAALAEVGRLYARIQVVDPIEDEEPIEIDGAGNAETWADAIRLQREGIEPERFAAITAPVLMLHGTADPHPGPETCDRLRRFVPQLEYMELEGCGHEPWRERAGRAPFIATLAAWLEARAAV